VLLQQGVTFSCRNRDELLKFLFLPAEPGHMEKRNSEYGVSLVDTTLVVVLIVGVVVASSTLASNHIATTLGGALSAAESQVDPSKYSGDPSWQYRDLGTGGGIDSAPIAVLPPPSGNTSSQASTDQQASSSAASIDPALQ